MWRDPEYVSHAHWFCAAVPLNIEVLHVNYTLGECVAVLQWRDLEYLLHTQLCHCTHSSGVLVAHLMGFKDFARQLMHAVVLVCAGMAGL